MACFHPWRQRIADGALWRTLPCGRCEGCLLERSRQWAVRCMHEASLHDENCMITLTYADEHLPVGGTLDREAMPRFVKRMRKVARFRYFQCGEYGTVGHRPHYHALMFGYDFPDKVRWTERNGLPVWRSPLLEEKWPFGQSEIGSVTFESAAYVARYVVKKLPKVERERVALDTGEVYEIEPEHVTMSRRPAIGKGWFEKWGDEVFPFDEVVSRGRVMRPPRYYDKLHEMAAPEAHALVKRERQRSRDLSNSSPKRLHVREVCVRARLNLYGRPLE